jgi:tRNA A-37 threonylcarbamoyl transferase component Bud32
MSDDIAHFLQECDAFRSLSAESALQLASQVHEEVFEAGSHLVHRGDTGTCMFVIREGQVTIPVENEEGRLMFTAHLGPREVFGEMALLTDEPRSANVVAWTRCRCVIIPRTIITEFLQQHPEVASFLTNILGKRLLEGRGISKVGKYRLTGEIIGRGGMAIVFEGLHPELERYVAIKMLSHTLIYRRHFAERFRNEARIIANLRHPNIVEVFDFEESWATIFIVMEKLVGRDIEQILDAQGVMDPDQVRRVLTDVASALEYAHRKGIVHRDVKPSNVIISPDGRIKLTDFGIAAVDHIEKSMVRDRGIYLGTPVYSSPEHAMGLPVDGRSDIYALGIVAYEMLTGQAPFDHEDIQVVLRHHCDTPMPSPRLLRPGIPDDLEAFIMKACAKRPEDRFQTCQEIVDLFESSHRRRTLPHAVGFRSVNLIYSPEAESEVERLMKRFEEQAAAIEGVSIRIR